MRHGAALQCEGDNQKMRTLKAGDVVRLSVDIDLAPYGIVRAGSRGTVIYKTAAGALEVLMEGKQPALEEWERTTMPFTPMDGGLALTLLVEDPALPLGFRKLEPLWCVLKAA